MQHRIQFFEKTIGHWQQGLPRCREFDPPRMPLEQLHPPPFFQARNLMADGTGGEVQLERSTRKTARLRGADEGLKHGSGWRALGHQVLTLIRMIPQTMTNAESIRRQPNCSRKNSAAMMAPIITLVSRRAETLATASSDNANRTKP